MKLEKEKIIFLLSISGFVICVDQLTKILVHTFLKLHESSVVVPDLLNITYVRNFAAAFGFMSQLPSYVRNFILLSTPPLVAIIIIYFLSVLPPKPRWPIFSLCLIFGGAMGNYLDRFNYGYVVDFIDFHMGAKYAWPAFNVADMAIVTGVLSLIAHLLLEKKVSHATNH